MSGSTTDSTPDHASAALEREGGVPRRQVLAGAAATLGVIAVAGCSSSTKASGSAPSASASSATQSASSSKAAAAAKPLAKLTDVPVGGAVSATGPDGKPLIVAQPTAGKVVAFSAICTHMGCTVKPAGKQLHCPCHGSVYDATTGKNLSGPAPRPLSAVAVHVTGGEVVEGA